MIESINIIRDGVSRAVSMVIYSVTKGRGEKRSFPMPKVASFEDAVALFGLEEALAILQEGAKEKAKSVSLSIEEKRSANPAYILTEEGYWEEWEESDVTPGRVADPNSKTGLQNRIAALKEQAAAWNTLLPLIITDSVDINNESHAEAIASLGDKWGKVESLTDVTQRLAAIAMSIGSITSEQAKLQAQKDALPVKPRAKRVKTEAPAA